MDKGQPLLQLIGVCKRYDSVQSGERLDILKDINLQVAPAESIAVVGPSGSGKSTLLNIIGTLDRPSEGKVLLNGRDLSALDEDALAAVRNREIGFIFQAHHLLPHCNVLENVLVPTLPNKTLARDETVAKARKLLERVGLGNRLEHRPGQLSGGERQRVAVVRALINGPKLLLADEPTGSLDAASAINLGELLLELNREQNLGLIVVTHSADLARKMGTVFELKAGRLSSFVP